MTSPEAFMVAFAPFEIDQVPPLLGWVYCDVLLAHTVVAPEIAKLMIVFPIKLEVAPVLPKLVKVPFKALVVLSIAVVIVELLPPAIPWLKS